MMVWNTVKRQVKLSLINSRVYKLINKWYNITKYFGWGGRMLLDIKIILIEAIIWSMLWTITVSVSVRVFPFMIEHDYPKDVREIASILKPSKYIRSKDWYLQRSALLYFSVYWLHLQSWHIKGKNYLFGKYLFTCGLSVWFGI